ncbi:Cupin domain-containing protein [Hydrogenivirga caldilitoris]|uniref:Cupin domain-containing protein n=1 Tax=Hydrogenivirga caldilitoris TaxID=246264 RepID=A0A497XRI1_9AQUI|nr:cupin domain-containing protein [Hydrogenivirga caldilitoris]RLJ70884.1 Cupin domain-containing protein [Hydrogenivirga caldilitoris]
MKHSLSSFFPTSSQLKKALLVDSKEARVIVFSMPAGSEIPAHTSPARVLLYCAKGSGKFLKGEEWIEVEEGDLVPCEPLEPHGMKADKDMVVMAVIAPAP